MLRTEHDNDNGWENVQHLHCYTLNMWFELQMSESDGYRPQEANKEEFELNSMRCGRKLTKDGDVSWTLAIQNIAYFCFE